MDLNLNILQDNRAPWFWPVWNSVQGDLAVSNWCRGSSCENPVLKRMRRSSSCKRHSHQWTVQASPCCAVARSGHCWRTCEWFHC